MYDQVRILNAVKTASCQSVAVISDCASNKLSLRRIELFIIGALTVFPDLLLLKG